MVAHRSCPGPLHHQLDLLPRTRCIRADPDRLAAAVQQERVAGGGAPCLLGSRASSAATGLTGTAL